MKDYQRIAEAITYIQEHFRSQPTLEEVASQVHLSPFHFQRMFKDWAGISPKKFLQFVSLGHAKQLLMEQTPLFDTSVETGLSGSSRLHDLFISMEGMTPGEYKNQGAGLDIHYQVAESTFGTVLIASTPKGICHISYLDGQMSSVDVLRAYFPLANFTAQPDPLHQSALSILNGNWEQPAQVKLHLKATPFQLKVWEALIKVPFGSATTYAGLAQKIEQPKASRAVGSAMAANPIAYIIPCHRVIRASGAIGQYHWGETRKTAMLGVESLQTLDPVFTDE